MSEHHEDRRVDGGMRPEYVDFDVDEFPGGLAACLEAMLMVSDQPQQPADLARVLAVDEPQVTAALNLILPAAAVLLLACSCLLSVRIYRGRQF